MTLPQWFIVGSIAFLLFTAFVHSVLGEMKLIAPLLKHRGNPVLDHSLARLILRFAWHITSLMWILLAVVLYVIGFNIEASASIILHSIGICFVGIGVFDLIVSKGKHIGWPFLTLIGVFALFAANV